MSTPELVGRTFLALGYAMLCMLGVAAVALFLSTVTESPLGAALGTMALLVASTLLLTLDAADPLQPYLPTRYWLAFVDLFRDPILWRDVAARRPAAGGLRRGVPRRRLGQLHDQGRHRLGRAGIVADEETPLDRSKSANVCDYPEPQTGGGTSGAAGPSTASTIAITAGVRGTSAVVRPGAGAHLLERDVERAVEGPGVRRHHGLVVLGPQRDPHRSRWCLVAGVEPAEQVGVGVELLARRGARRGAERRPRATRGRCRGAARRG